ncbi:MAG: D-alanyl-D-alanine carboxypeptidase family protein [Eubacteriales bacterium]|nr:D-alanyl-D-alanine carboxypeptidase family protein [Eubacteriales bacterium]
MCLLAPFFGAQTEAAEKPENLYAQSAVLMDADSGRVLFEKNGEEQRAMASTTKIMTCILALELGELSDIVTASSYAASQPSVHLGMYAGEQFRLEDLLYSLMLESHNDSAVAIAEQVGGSVEGFAKLMNQKAAEIGCEQTHFVTPNGLDSEDEGGIHSTTARDLALIMRYCISQSPQKETFLEITGSQSHSFSNLEGTRSYSSYNHNAFLTMMDGAISGKTGYTGDAGYCYVGALKRGERTFIVALLACGWPSHKTYKWSDTRKLMEYALASYEYQDVLEQTEIPDILVENGVSEDGSFDEEVYVKALLESPEELKVLMGEEDTVSVKAVLPESLEAPVKEGTQIGEVDYYLNGEKICTCPVRAQSTVPVIGFSWCLEQILRRFWF